MKKLIYLILLIMVLPLNAQNKVEQIRGQLYSRDTSKVIVCAHRGDWRNFPENSLEGLKSAIDMGVDIVELDVQMTKDSVLIVIHDDTLERTTTGKGKICDVKSSELTSLFLRNGCGIRTGQRIPTLEQALLLAKGKIMLNLDKADRYFEQVYELLEKTGTTSQIIMKGSSDFEHVKEKFGKYLDEVIYMPIVNLDKDDAYLQIESFLKELKPVAFELLFREDTNELPLRLKDILSDNSLIWYNTLWNTMAGGHDDDASLRSFEQGYGYLIDKLGARIIQTDRPQFLLEYLRKRNLHD